MCSRQTCTQGAVTLVTMAVPIMFSLLALVRVEHYRSTQHEKLHQDRETVIQQTALLDEGQPLTVSQETLQASVVQRIFEKLPDACV